MKKYSLLAVISFLFISITVISCGKDDADEYTPLPISPVVLDLDAAPYPKLSDYNFFEGEMKNLQPVYGVLPYDLNSSLFTDYALKKRFVWMPSDVKANYVADGKILDFPVGTVLIKNFYYNNVQPNNETIIIETRLIIKKPEGWIFANYVWNDEQTEAFFNTEGGISEITWLMDGVPTTINYQIPSSQQCLTCHKNNDTPTPIGLKPQNLNKIYTYGYESKNQLTKWIDYKYLDANFPANILSTVNWEDENQALELRARSYLDINCAHCHTEGAYCSYTPMDLAFNKTSEPVNLGICVEPVDFVTGNQSYLIAAGNIRESLIYFRMQTTIPEERMPPIGRSVTDGKAIELMEEWITSLGQACP